MIHLVYISSATSSPSENDLKELLEQSRERNLRQNITGMLLYDNSLYMQVLEGEEEDVHDIYNSILKDDRNDAQYKLIEETISQREFSNWTMGFKRLSGSSSERLEGFQDVFGRKKKKEVAALNASKALELLMRFAKKDA